MSEAARRLLRTLADAGVEVCFTNPGTTEIELVAALDSEPRLRPVLTLFEGVATGAADGYARMRERPAATLLHLGCGLGNGLANLHNARRAGVPVLNLVGDHASSHRAYDAPLQSDIETVARNVSAWVRTCASADSLCGDALQALAAALGPPAGVATLIVPADVSWGEDAGAPVAPVAQPARPAPVAEAAIEEAARALVDAGPAALLLGGHALREPALLAAARITERSGARLFAETFPTRMERGAGLPAVERIAYLPELAAVQLDGLRSVVLVGARPPAAFFAYPGRSGDLLPPACTACGLAAAGDDVDDALQRLADRLGARQATPRLQQPALPRPARGSLSAQKVCREVGRLLPQQAIVVDEAQTSAVMLPLYTAGAPRHDLLTLTGGAIGQGLPLAVGAAIACPQRPVIALVGDGAALYTLQALWTMARERLHVVCVVFNNRSYAILNLELQRLAGGRAAAGARSQFDLGEPPLDFVRLADGLGVPGVRAATAEEFAAAFAHALASPGPHLIEAVVPPAIGGLKLRLLPRLLRRLDAMPRPLARAIQRKVAP